MASQPGTTTWTECGPIMISGISNPKFEGSIEKVDECYVLKLGCRTRVAKDLNDTVKKIKEELKGSGMFNKEKK